MTTKKLVRNIALLQGAAIMVCGAQLAYAGANVNVNINLGEPPRPVVVVPPPAPAPAPVYVAPAPAAVYEPPLFEVQEDIHFVYPNRLGFYVAVGVPYDLFFIDNSYYLYRDGRWLRAASSRGPWLVQGFRELPPGLRRHRLERIREYRNREYVIYKRDRDHYRGRHFLTEKERWRAERREAHELRKEEHHREKELRKEEKRHEKERRKEEHRRDKEERRERRD